MIPLIVYLLLINALGLLLMLVDKLKAQKNKWRISESTLMTVAAIGGSMGSYIGMQLFRHKTMHPKFSLGLPVLLACHIVLLILIYPLLK